MTPWITKPVPFNIGQGAAGAGVTPDFWVDDVGTWVNDGGQTSKASPAGYKSYNATVASSPSQTAIISILDFSPYYFCMFDTAAYLASSGGQSPPISYDERACEYGFLCRSEDSTLNANKITAVIDADTSGGYSDDALTTSSKIKMIITSTTFSIKYSVDGTFTDTVDFFDTTFSSDTTDRLLVVNNNKGSSVDDNSLTAEFE